jgi:hypothetical protein
MPESPQRAASPLFDPAQQASFGDYSVASGCPVCRVAVVHAMPERKSALGPHVTGQLLDPSCVNGRLESSLLPRKRRGFGT